MSKEARGKEPRACPAGGRNSNRMQTLEKNAYARSARRNARAERMEAARQIAADRADIGLSRVINYRRLK